MDQRKKITRQIRKYFELNERKHGMEYSQSSAKGKFIALKCLY